MDSIFLPIYTLGSQSAINSGILTPLVNNVFQKSHPSLLVGAIAAGAQYATGHNVIVRNWHNGAGDIIFFSIAEDSQSTTS